MTAEVRVPVGRSIGGSHPDLPGPFRCEVCGTGLFVSDLGYLRCPLEFSRRHRIIAGRRRRERRVRALGPWAAVLGVVFLVAGLLGDGPW